MSINHQHVAIPLPITHPKLRDYLPLAVVVCVIVGATLAVCAQTSFTFNHILGYSMGFFFLLFGMFKLLDLRNFAMGYREYDLITKNLPAWGYVYPFVELGLGGLFLLGDTEPRLLITTILLSVLTCVSVAIKLAKKEVIQCVCLGNILKVPLTYVSLVEYGLMGLMAVAMLFV